MSQISLTEKDWNRLLPEIDKGNVILILGDWLSRVKVDETLYKLKDYVLKKHKEALNVDESTEMDFCDLSYDYMRSAWQDISSNPYAETRDILYDLPKKCFDKEDLKRLLEIDRFKLILTTSFDDTIYNVEKELYPDEEILQLSYKKNSNKPDIPYNNTPRIIYHIFGKANAAPHSFVLTEDDLLDFMHLWMDQNYRPQNLTNYLKSKYLLVIGCDYPNWLFRFFFHSLKYNSGLKNSGPEQGAATDLLADKEIDKDLLQFLKRMETRAHGDPKAFIEELEERWKDYIKKKESSDSPANTNSIDNTTDTEYEAFISYASEDYEIAEDIAQTFNELGLKVWFDKADLNSGEKYERKIEDHINSKCKYFIPVISIHTDTPEPRFFKKEWYWASEAVKAHFGLNDGFIRPVSIGNYKMRTDHPFSKYHCVDLSSADERKGNIRKIIRSLRTQ